VEIEFQCPQCGSRNAYEKPALSEEVDCVSCKKVFDRVSDFANETGGVQYCPICRCRDLYTQKDFSRKVGCTIAAVGAILAPFTKLISLLVCALIDLILYKALPVITICYRCKAIYRGFPLNPAHTGFNLGINDRYRADLNTKTQRH